MVILIDPSQRHRKSVPVHVFLPIPVPAIWSFQSSPYHTKARYIQIIRNPTTAVTSDEKTLPTAARADDAAPPFTFTSPVATDALLLGGATVVVTVCPLITVVVVEAPGPILYVVPLITASVPSMEKVSPPAVTADKEGGADVIVAGRTVVVLSPMPFEPMLMVWPLRTTSVAEAPDPIL